MTKKFIAKSEPYHHAGLTETVHLDYAVVDDITEGEYHHASGNGSESDIDCLDFDKVGYDETHAEHNRKDKKRQGEGIAFFLN